MTVDPRTIDSFAPAATEPRMPAVRQMKQRSPEWRQKRLGVVTMSRALDLMVQPRTKAAREAGEWSQSAQSYLNEKLSELIHCQPSDVWRSDATDWGTVNEPHAFELAIPAIKERFGGELSLPEGEYAFLEHPTEPHIGCSPDGIIGDDGLCEIKAPYSGAKWIAAKRRGLVIPKEYIPQVQGSLWVASRQWYTFCYFDPRVVASGLDPLLMIRVERDNEYIDNDLAPRVLAFRDWLRSEYRQLVGDKEPF